MKSIICHCFDQVRRSGFGWITGQSNQAMRSIKVFSPSIRLGLINRQANRAPVAWIGTLDCSDSLCTIIEGQALQNLVNSPVSNLLIWILLTTQQSVITAVLISQLGKGGKASYHFLLDSRISQIARPARPLRKGGVSCVRSFACNPALEQRWEKTIQVELCKRNSPLKDSSERGTFCQPGWKGKTLQGLQPDPSWCRSDASLWNSLLFWTKMRVI